VLCLILVGPQAPPASGGIGFNVVGLAVLSSGGTTCPAAWGIRGMTDTGGGCGGGGWATLRSGAIVVVGLSWQLRAPSSAEWGAAARPMRYTGWATTSSSEGSAGVDRGFRFTRPRLLAVVVAAAGGGGGGPPGARASLSWRPPTRRSPCTPPSASIRGAPPSRPALSSARLVVLGAGLAGLPQLARSPPPASRARARSRAIASAVAGGLTPRQREIAERGATFSGLDAGATSRLCDRARPWWHISLN